MAEFSLHVRLDAVESGPEDGNALLTPYVDAYETVEFGSESLDDADDPASVVPDTSSLEIDGVETFAEIYDDLRTKAAVRKLLLWGPTAERFPTPVQHYALQQLTDPTLYEYHAIDEQVTLVIAESQLEAQRVRQEVPAAAIGYQDSPF